jgi:hypothetical protein
LKNLSEAEVDAWFAARGIQHADIQLQISPFAEQHWLDCFPRYTLGLDKELAYYDAVLDHHLVAYSVAQTELSPTNRQIALSDAYEAFFTPNIQLGEVAHMHCLYRHALATFHPPPEEYKLPPLNDEDYNLLAPLPERAALAHSTSPA